MPPPPFQQQSPCAHPGQTTPAKSTPVKSTRVKSTRVKLSPVKRSAWPLLAVAGFGCGAICVLVLQHLAGDRQLAVLRESVQALERAVDADRAAVPAVAAPELTVRQIVYQSCPAVVAIDVQGPNFKGGFGTGSGFFVDDQGTVVTNLHVVAGATSTKICCLDNSPRKILGFAAVSPTLDLVVLRTERVPGAGGAEPEKFLRISAETETVFPGDPVLAIGAPLAMSWSVSNGIVSAIRDGASLRTVLKHVTDNEYGQNDDDVWLQTSAPISSGNSGGPLINDLGEVLGVVTWTVPAGQNINFASGAKHVRELLAQAVGKPTLPLADLPRAEVRSSGLGQHSAVPVTVPVHK